MSVSENSVVRKVLGTKRADLTGEGWRLHKEGLRFLYSSPNNVLVIKSRRIRWARYVARMGERRGVYRDLVGIPDGKKQFGSPRRRWEENIEVDLQEIKREPWIGFSWFRIWRELL